MNYLTKTPLISFTFLDFSPCASCPTNCGNPVYTILNQDGSALNSDCNSTMFTFLPASRYFSIMSNDIYNVGNYHMIVKGEALPYSV